ncbi:hypothetical protein QTP88_009709 [Uroleucon formosanum]
MNSNIQPTYEQMQNEITELMRTYNKLRQELFLMQANYKLLQLNNEELSLEVKKSQLNTTISNTSVFNNVNVGEKPTQKNIKNQLNGDTHKVYKPPPIAIKGVKHFDKLKKLLTCEEPFGQEQKFKILSNSETKILTTNESHFRSTIKTLEENNIEHHRYQLKNEKLFRVVLRERAHPKQVNVVQRVKQKPSRPVTTNISYVQMASTSSASRDNQSVPQMSIQQPKENNDPRLNDILVVLTNVTQTLVNITARMYNGRARGGSAEIIKESIKHYEHEKYSENHIQAASVFINNGLNNLIITAIYCPPLGVADDIKFTAFFHTLGARFIAGGDYNSKHTHWCSRLITLEELRYNTNAEIISTRKVTYWPSEQNKNPDVDFFVMKGISSNYVEIIELVELTLDYMPVLLTLSSNVIIKQPNISTTNYSMTAIFSDDTAILATDEGQQTATDQLQ